MKCHTKFELTFLVPRAARAGIAMELLRGSAKREDTTLEAIYLDTKDRCLARAGLAWRVQREGRRWIQTLNAGGSNALEQFEHEVTRPDASADAEKHAGTPPGDELIMLLRHARRDGEEPSTRFRTEVLRTARRIRARGAVVEVSFDEGQLVVAGASLRVCELGFELVSGSAAGLLSLAEHWRRRYSLVYDPCSIAERGDRLADGSSFRPLRRACRPDYAHTATASEAFGIVMDECLAQITRNAIALIEGDPLQSVEHVHQLRVGIRRLRTALRSFRGWVTPPPGEIVEGIRSLFSMLGASRDSDVLRNGVVAELAKAGAPPLKRMPQPVGPSPVDAVLAAETQRTFLAWIAWRAALAPFGANLIARHGAESQSEQHRAADHAARAEGAACATALHSRRDSQRIGHAELAANDDPLRFRTNAVRRLRRWHSQIVSGWKSFDDLDDAGLHALRKRIKRQRYAVEFLAPLLRRRQVESYLDALNAIQDRMGNLNDLIVARARHKALVAADPAAWFALGWLEARISELRALAKPELARLAEERPPAA